MIKKSILNRNLFMINDENMDKIYFGCNQEWYISEWQRRAGCGPTTASNFILYMMKKQFSTTSDQRFNSKEECLSLMKEVWEYVTPTVKGIPTTKMFCELIMDYIKSKGLNVLYNFINIPEERDQRPGFQELLDFIEQALENDAPIAFLNLCNGEEKNLDRWHWVTVISLEYTEDKSSSFISILDEGLIKRIDLALWYKTTMLGGGFVYLK